MTPPDSARTYRNACREALFVGVIWFLALLWVVGYSYFFGYVDGQDVTTILGMPSWVFGGIVVPGLICTVITVIFSVYGIADDALGEDRE